MSRLQLPEGLMMTDISLKQVDKSLNLQGQMSGKSNKRNAFFCICRGGPSLSKAAINIEAFHPYFIFLIYTQTFKGIFWL